MSEDKSLSPYHASPFDAIRQINERGEEFWSARDLQPLLGYEKWQNFEETIDRALFACQNSGHNIENNFTGASKPIISGKGRTQNIQDYHLTRFACYLTAMNGDPRKPEIAAAQTYFAIKTREAETAQQGATPAAQLAFEFDFTLRIRSASDIPYAQAIITAAKSVVDAKKNLQGLLDGTTPPKTHKKATPEQKQLTAPKSPRESVYQCILRLNRKGKPPTIRDLSRYLTRIDHETIYTQATELAMEGVVGIEVSSHGTRYRSLEPNF